MYVADLKRSIFRSLQSAAFAGVLLASSGSALAAGTAVGTSIENTATVDFTVGGTPLTVSSNTTSIVVAERLDVVVTLQSGQVLVSANGRHSARIRADGSLVTAQATGSIHKVGAELQGAPSCNGWTYWHYQSDGQPVPIDVLRQQLRAEMRD